uniref:protein-tyrosine-phosphatase n=1 Tax=Meloidogyne floridensis TaxID=298350 RepID=A0A915P228_9BILA
MINKILDCIFIGDIFSNDEINIEKFKIQTVLTLSSQPLALEKRIIGVNYQFIYMLDVENQNIFSSNILQKTFNLLQKCLENNQTILEKHSIAKPNNSFIKQLELFEKIGFITDPINLKKSEIFRDFVASNGYLFELNDNTSKYNLEESYLSSSKKFSCKKCRKILFFDFNVLKHFSDNKNIFCEFGYLITPMVWMELDELKGKTCSKLDFSES